MDSDDFVETPEPTKASKTMQGGGSDTVEKMMVGSGGGLDSYQVVFVKDNVSVHPTQYARERISGRLRLIKQGPSLFMTWIPYALDGAGRRKSAEKDRNLYTIRAVSLAEMRSIRRHTPAFGLQYIIVVLTSGLAFPPLYFHIGGVKEFLSTLRGHASLVRSNDDSNVYLVNDVQDPLQRSLTSLELTDIPPLPPVVVEAAPVVVVPVESPSGSSSVYGQGPRREASRDMITLLEKFSIVTKFARDTTAHLFGESGFLGNSEMILDRAPIRSHDESVVSRSTGALPCDAKVPSSALDGKEASSVENEEKEREM